MSVEEILLIIFYAVLFSFIILRSKFFDRFSLSKKLLIALFLFRAATGILYGWIHIHFYTGGDTFTFFHDSKIVMNSFSEDPFLFFKLLFGINHRPPDPGIYEYARKMEYWTDMSSYFIVRINVLMDLFSFTHYYVNVVIYDFLTFAGILYLFKFLADFLPDKKNLLLILLFVFPSVAFWSAGMHKDGISLSAIGLILFHAEKIFEKKFNLKIILALLVGCWLLIVVRNYLLLLLFPALLSYLIFKSSTHFALLKSVTAFLIFYVILFNLKIIFPSFDFLQSMAKQQLEFLSVTPRDKTLPYGLLDGSIPGLLNSFPTAIKDCLFQPTVTAITSPLQVSSLIDNWIIILLLVFGLIFMKKMKASEVSILLFCLLFSFSLFWFTGSIVPNLGALVRYKMPGMFFISVGFLSIFNLEKINKVLFRSPAKK